MADGTLIEWSDATWNIINGCSVRNPGIHPYCVHTWHPHAASVPPPSAWLVE